MKLKALLNRNLQQDLDDELASHIAMKAEELQAGGLSPIEADREARRRFGNVTRTKESTRDLHMFTLLESLFQDLRYGLRRLRHEPAFTLAAVLTLGLVIGANGTIFSVLEAILLRPLPFSDPESLVVVMGSHRQSTREAIPIVDFEELGKARSLAALVAEQTQSVNLTGVEEPGRLIGGFVSFDYFKMLGVQPVKGRAFTAEEGREGGPRVCVLSAQVWRNRFGGDPNMLGRTLTLNAEAYVVVGILPESYRPTFTNAEVWMPVHFYPNYSRTRGRETVTGIGRLAPGMSIEQARAELAGISQRLAQEFPETNRDRGVTVQPARTFVEGDSRSTLFVLIGAVSGVLLLGCANIAGLLLTKAAGRKHEMAIRASVGASRGRLMRQLLTECLLLSLFGGALGIALAYGGMQLLVAYGGFLVRGVELQLNTTVLLYLIGASLATGVLFGLAPALLARRESANTLRQRGIGSSQGAFRSLLVAGQVALALVLLIGSGLMMKSMANVAAIDPGFRGENVLTMEYRIPRLQYPQGSQQTQFHHEVIARVGALPGVKSAALVGALPFSGNRNADAITLPDRPLPSPDAPWIVQSNSATPGYFETAGIPLVAGRDFAMNDRADSARVAIVSAAFVTRFWPGQNAVGKQVNFPVSDRASERLTVVGVVGNTKHDSLDEPDAAQIYRPYAQTPFIFATLAVRTNGDPLAMTKAVQRAIWSIDKNQPMWKIRTLQSLVDRSFSVRRDVAWLLAGFAALALGLAAIGLYGVLAYAVNQRTAEFGVRMALGASPSEILMLVMRKGVALTLSGLAAGVIASLFLSQFLQSQVFGMTTTDPAVYAVLALVLLVVAIVAVWLPARRAMLVDPLVAIRQE
jgi:putative ABC transport system permease protein